ncbi:Calcipressin [Multifurca ochricompacta]|uniref:Calcipressin n=1 Tax=Multifurca ochricompacta TaxID=376703 RepID=A0AAD4M617_9AGAM|nr:Calcipressin [Multifurca ochricompacta]
MYPTTASTLLCCTAAPRDCLTAIAASRTSKRTNTLILTQLPTPFFHERVMDVLRDHFVSHGAIRAWAPLRTFARVIIVYESEDSADEAKSYCDGLEIDATSETPAFVLRVFRADPTPVTPPGGGHLRPPPIEKNFLISPPGSPPVGWEQVTEDPPNAAPLADDLIAALRKLQLAAGAAANGDGAGIGVYVEDCDMEEHGFDEERNRDWAYGEDNPSRISYKQARTTRPPMLS